MIIIFNIIYIFKIINYKIKNNLYKIYNILINYLIKYYFLFVEIYIFFFFDGIFIELYFI